MCSFKNYIDVFVITNGRESYKYVIKSLQEQQNVSFNLFTIEGMSWIEAHYKCLSYSNAPFFFRIDDDMLLHKDTFRYYYNQLENIDINRVAVYGNILWEPWNNRTCGIVKVYNRKLAKYIGFQADSRGKVDKIFKKKCKEEGYKILKGNGVVGIHAACKFADNMKYSQLRNEIKDPLFKIRKREIVKLDRIYKKISLKKQLDMCGEDLYKFNKQHNTLFSKFVDKGDPI